MLSSQSIMASCQRLYGDCTDGSYEACLAYEGYYAAKEREQQDEAANLTGLKSDQDSSIK